MTRKEQIEKAATDYIASDAVSPTNMQMAFGDFINGANWADGHPNQTFLLDALSDLRQVRKALDKIDNMELDREVAIEVYYAKYKLADAYDNIELLIDEEE